MVDRVLISSGEVKVSRPTVWVLTASLGDLILSLAARQAQILFSGYVAMSSRVRLDTYNYTCSASVALGGLPALADAVVQPVVLTPGTFVSDPPIANTHHTCGQGFMYFNDRSYIYAYVQTYYVLRPGPLTINFDANTLSMSGTFRSTTGDGNEFAGFSYAVYRKPLAA